jgi:hypothetical protein
MNVANETAVVHLVLFNGRREPLPADAQVLIRLTNGAQEVKTITGKGPVYHITVPFTDGPRDRYTVTATATGYVDAGFHPVDINPRVEQTVSLMLLPHDGEFNFADSQWESLQRDLLVFLAAGADSPATAQNRYETLLENDPPSLACILNIVTAMRDMDFDPFSHFQQLIWTGKSPQGKDIAPAQDRFFAYADRQALIDKLETAVKRGTFEKEPNIDLALHPGSTLSYKQIEFNEANVQFTFHENDETPNGNKWVVVEPDIDFFKDLGAHTLLEVIPGFFTLTDPKGVYVLRWIAAKQARIRDFNPPYVIA